MGADNKEVAWILLDGNIKPIFCWKKGVNYVFKC